MSTSNCLMINRQLQRLSLQDMLEVQMTDETKQICYFKSKTPAQLL